MKLGLVLAIALLSAGGIRAGDVAPGMNRFAVASYRQLAEKQGNLVLSPFNMSIALSMLLDGARDQTAAAIAATLDQPYPATDYHQAVASLAARLIKQGNQGKNQLAVANGLWLQAGLPLQLEFERTIRAIYGARLTPLNFRFNAEQARREINSWTVQNTKGKITELLPPGSIDSRTRLSLTSAIYFYGAWDLPFNARNTRAEPFHPHGGGTVKANFMHQDGRFRYGETPFAQVLEMKYRDTPLAFDIVLPKATDGLKDLERSLDGNALSGWLGVLKNQNVEVSIPKFRIEASFSLRDALSRLGMAVAFGREADFSGINGRRNLAVSNVFHKAFVDVSEEGTEAAAATAITIVPMSAPAPQQPIVFRADHPFMFFIRDTETGVILFAGRLAHP